MTISRTSSEGEKERDRSRRKRREHPLGIRHANSLFAILTILLRVMSSSKMKLVRVESRIPTDDNDHNSRSFENDRLEGFEQAHRPGIFHVGSSSARRRRSGLKANSYVCCTGRRRGRRRNEVAADEKRVLPFVLRE